MKLSALKLIIKKGTESLEEMMPRIMDFFKQHVKEHGGSMAPGQIAKWMSEELPGVTLPQANQAVNAFVQKKMNDARESYGNPEQQKLRKIVERTKKEIAERTKKEIADPGSLPPLMDPTKKSAYKVRITKKSVARNTFKKRASFESMAHAPFTEKASIIRDYIEKFPSAKVAAQALLDEIIELKKLLEQGGGGPFGGGGGPVAMARQAGTISNFFSNLTGALTVLACLITYGAAGTSTWIAKYGHTHPDGASEASAAVAVILSWGAVGLTMMLYKVLKSLGSTDMNENTEKPQKKLYEGFNK